MKTASLLGLFLVIAGAIALAYQGITYTTHKRVLDVGPIEATKTEHKTIPLPPIVGGLMLVGGIALLATGRKEA
jgi:drug/metabolite transporter (DMT)-like permease